MNKIYFKKLIVIFSLIIIIFPFFVFAQEPPKCPDGGTPALEKGLLSGICVKCYDKGDCDFKDILVVAFNGFNFLRDKIALPIAIIMVVVGGGMMILSGGSKKMIEKGRGTFNTAIIGFLIVFGVSVIINSFLLIITFGKITNWIEFFKSALGGSLPF
jgi:hypothetical protein